MLTAATPEHCNPTEKFAPHTTFTDGSPIRAINRTSEAEVFRALLVIRKRGNVGANLGDRIKSRSLSRDVAIAIMASGNFCVHGSAKEIQNNFNVKEGDDQVNKVAI